MGLVLVGKSCLQSICPHCSFVQNLARSLEHQLKSHFKLLSTLANHVRLLKSRDLEMCKANQTKSNCYCWLAAEIGRIKSNDKLTARQRRNRQWMLNETKRHCAVKDFIQLKESRLNKIRILKQQREREENKNERFRQIVCLIKMGQSFTTT